MAATDAEIQAVQKLAAEQLIAWTKYIQMVQLRLRCAEIIFVSGSVDQKKDLAKSAEVLYAFAVTIPPTKVGGK